MAAHAGVSVRLERKCEVGVIVVVAEFQEVVLRPALANSFIIQAAQVPVQLVPDSRLVGEKRGVTTTMSPEQSGGGHVTTKLALGESLKLGRIVEADLCDPAMPCWLAWPAASPTAP